MEDLVTILDLHLSYGRWFSDVGQKVYRHTELMKHGITKEKKAKRLSVTFMIKPAIYCRNISATEHHVTLVQIQLIMLYSKEGIYLRNLI